MQCNRGYHPRRFRQLHGRGPIQRLRSRSDSNIRSSPDVQIGAQRYPEATTKTGMNGAEPFIPVCLCDRPGGMAPSYLP